MNLLLIIYRQKKSIEDRCMIKKISTLKKMRVLFKQTLQSGYSFSLEVKEVFMITLFSSMVFAQVNNNSDSITTLPKMNVKGQEKIFIPFAPMVLPSSLALSYRSNTHIPSLGYRDVNNISTKRPLIEQTICTSTIFHLQRY